MFREPHSNPLSCISHSLRRVKNALFGGDLVRASFCDLVSVTRAVYRTLVKSELLAKGYRAPDGHTVLKDVSEHGLVTPKLFGRFW
jgi:hypothetical protein